MLHPQESWERKIWVYTRKVSALSSIQLSLLLGDLGMADGCKGHSDHSDHKVDEPATASFLLGDAAKSSHTLCRETAHMQDLHAFLEAVGRNESHFEDMISRIRRKRLAKFDVMDFCLANGNGMHRETTCSSPRSFRESVETYEPNRFKVSL